MFAMGQLSFPVASAGTPSPKAGWKYVIVCSYESQVLDVGFFQSADGKKAASNEREVLAKFWGQLMPKRAALIVSELSILLNALVPSPTEFSLFGLLQVTKHR